MTYRFVLGPPEEQAGIGDVVQQQAEPVPDLVRAGLPVVHLLRYHAVGDRTARHRRDDADIAVTARIGQVQQQAGRPHRRAMPATGQGNANSGHGSPLRLHSAWSLPGIPSTPLARSVRSRIFRRLIQRVGDVLERGALQPGSMSDLRDTVSACAI
jgi:hypothetical protein